MSDNLKTVTIKRIKRGKITLKSGPKAGQEAETCNICVAGKSGDTWLNGFKSQANTAWQEGDKVEVEITKTEKNDKVYWNYKTPKPDYMKLITDLAERITTLQLEVSALKVKVGNREFTQELSEGEEEIPFG